MVRGTGKTFIAKEIANAIGYQVITINCNQFTSPLEIIGGQTIDGYQEGKLIRAWGNLNLDINPATQKPYEGALLLIDELPKLDPNTAGIMNDALSTVKDPPRVVNGKMEDKYIYNGRNERIALKNFFAVGTGNTQLLKPTQTILQTLPKMPRCKIDLAVLPIECIMITKWNTTRC